MAKQQAAQTESDEPAKFNPGKFGSLRLLEKGPALNRYEKLLVLLFFVATSGLTTYGITHPSREVPLEICSLALIFALLARTRKS
jgi:hypothetical protein